ncbi:hypothetical protein ABZ235_36250 [Streptomyces canus]|uniref:hypothetical protein n=1 Tax=Streptomyces canus TaxID=58343 RepID=UPI0033B37A2E
MGSRHSPYQAQQLYAASEGNPLYLLAEHRGDTVKAVRLLEAAAEQYGRCGQSLWEAYTLLRAAPLVQRKGQGARAAAMWYRAHRIAVGGGARLLVDLADTACPSFTLS